MFDIIRSIKKITGLQREERIEESRLPDQERTHVLEHKIDKFSHFVDNMWAYAILEFETIREKFQDLSKANYELGIKHLEEGNVREAIFRFKITEKFWPHKYEAYYELIYCLLLENEFDEAQKVIDDLLAKCPEYKEKIDQLLSPPEDSEDELSQAPEEDAAVDYQQNSQNPNQ